MIDTLLNLLFRCPHKRLTRPVTPVSRSGVPQGDTYVVCLECGKQFAYDTREMRIGKPIDSRHDSGVLHPEPIEPRARRLKFALWASLPLAVLIGSALKRENRSGKGAAPKKSGSD